MAQGLTLFQLIITDDDSKDGPVSFMKNISIVTPFPVQFEKNTKRLGYG
jgi:hypothetical protein